MAQRTEMTDLEHDLTESCASVSVQDYVARRARMEAINAAGIIRYLISTNANGY
jgi:hypothetical protein